LPPIVLDQDGESLDIPMGIGQPLGMFDPMSIDQQQFTIPEGGLALLFSDGLNEAVNSQGRPFGLERVKDELCLHRHESAQQICDKLWLAVQNHSYGIQHQDDFTTVLIKREKN